jgi:hypothetical protein
MKQSHLEHGKEWYRVSLVDIVHGIHEQATLASSVQANAVHYVMPLQVISVQPVNVACPCLEAMVPITDEEHMTTKRA